jgi:23S rRNA (uracil1939-C5)-methyltransferase
MNNASTCPHFSTCSGCTVENVLHPPLWQEVVCFFQKYQIEPHLITDGFEKKRFKAKLAVRIGPVIGLFKKNTHDVISIPHCLVHHPSINQAVKILQEEMKAHNILPYQENPPSGLLRYLQFFVEAKTGKVQLALVLNGTAISEDFCKSLLKYDLWHSIWFNFHPHSSNRIFGDSWELYHGEEVLWQTLNQTQVAFHPGAFSQAHLPLFEKILEKIESLAFEGEKILELYAGVGAIGLTLAKKSKNLTLVENNPYAFKSFHHMKTGLCYKCMDAKDIELEGYDLIVVDPPRKGLDPVVRAKLAKLSQARLIYLSCGFESFKKDAEELIASGWKIKESIGYLLFPGTNHVEILALFQK